MGRGHTDGPTVVDSETGEDVTTVLRGEGVEDVGGDSDVGCGSECGQWRRGDTKVSSRLFVFSSSLFFFSSAIEAKKGIQQDAATTLTIRIITIRSTRAVVFNLQLH